MKEDKNSDIQSKLNILSIKIIKLSYFITALLFMITVIGYLISNNITVSNEVKTVLKFVTASAVASLAVSIQITLIGIISKYTLNKRR